MAKGSVIWPSDNACLTLSRASSRGKRAITHRQKAWADAVTSAQLSALSPALGERERLQCVIYATSSSENKARGPTTRWLARLIEAAGEGLFAVPDRVAVQHGWRITAHHGGLGRCYRDPRFDTLDACRRCHGSGETDSEPCVPCGGSGRVTRVRSRQNGQSR
jgi:hypothetical protein